MIMEEDLNEDELEERLYAMIHYADDTQNNVDGNKQNESISTISAPQATVKRYWRTSGDLAPTNTQYQKVNTPINTQYQRVNTPINKETTAPQQPEVKKPDENLTRPKEEKQPDGQLKQDINNLSAFDKPSDNVKVTVKILDNDQSVPVVDLETSDEDEVVEVAVPPKPTITIESSDEDDVSVVATEHSQGTVKIKNKNKKNKKNNKRAAEPEREASPVPSVVSSVSDDFIRGDVIALNISSRNPEMHSFNFGLHGSDLLGTPDKKKKKKKNKDRENPIPIPKQTPEKIIPSNTVECFATPKNKSKKKQKSKLYTVTNKSLPNADVYDSDSNQSCDISKKHNSYTVTDKSVPSIDVYESDSSQSEIIQKTKPSQIANEITEVESSDSSISLTPTKEQNTTRPTSIPTSTPIKSGSDFTLSSIVDLTSDMPLEEPTIEENIVMANVTGFEEMEDYSLESQPSTEQDSSKSYLGSTKIPAILSANLDFDYLKGDESTSKRRRYSLATLRDEMDKFYNESWGGENFNHREIQKNMSRDKSLWEIDPKDKMPALYNKKKVTCNHCNRPGHRNDTCRMRTPVCHMCGSVGHYEPRCPRKICVNCGSPNHMYSSACRRCAGWGRVTCARCRQTGHPADHCPDRWRRYHSTIELDVPLSESVKPKRSAQQYCSGCARRGHLVHSCRNFLPFTGLPIYSPFVFCYRPMYTSSAEHGERGDVYMTPQRRKSFSDTLDSSYDQPRNRYDHDTNKRRSTSPLHVTHIAKKRNMSCSDKSDTPPSPRHVTSENKVTDQRPKENNPFDKALDYIPINSNHDKRGHVIQDNEVSDTSDVVTSARIYVPTDLMKKLHTPEAESWMTEKMKAHNVSVTPADTNSFLTIKGKLVDQEAFHKELRHWTSGPSEQRNGQDNPQEIDPQDPEKDLSNNIPKNKNNALRILNKAFSSLNEDLGDPKELYKELNYHRTNHHKLLSQKVISPQKLSNSSGHINDMLKKLNMVLLGQAGLAGGQTHLKQLQVLQQRLAHFRQKNLSLRMRREIGEHYHTIFTSLPRDDYQELLDNYYRTPAPQTRPPRVLKKRNNRVRPKPAPVERRDLNLFQSGPTPPRPLLANPFAGQPKATREGRNLVKKLTFYKNRIVNSPPPASAVGQRARDQLVSQLQRQITTFDNQAVVTPKVIKKLNFLRQNANRFLKNNVK